MLGKVENPLGSGAHRPGSRISTCRPDNELSGRQDVRYSNFTTPSMAHAPRCQSQVLEKIAEVLGLAPCEADLRMKKDGDMRTFLFRLLTLPGHAIDPLSFKPGFETEAVRFALRLAMVPGFPAVD